MYKRREGAIRNEEQTNYKGNIAWEYFILKKKKFSELHFDPSIKKS